MTTLQDSPQLVLRSLRHDSHVNLGVVVASASNVKRVTLVLENTLDRILPASVLVSDSLKKTFFVSEVRLVECDTVAKRDHVNEDGSARSTDIEDLSENVKYYDTNFLYDGAPVDVSITIPPSSSSHLLVTLSSTSALTERTKSHAPPMGILIEESIIPQTISGSILVSTTDFQESASIPVRARKCESWLRPDSELLDFGHCTFTDGWLFKDLMVSNLGEVDTSFMPSIAIRSCIDNADVKEMRLVDGPTGFEIGLNPTPIIDMTTRRFRVGLRPQQPGTFDQWISIQNTKNALDVWNIRVLARVTKQQLANSISVSCGSELDFGNSYANHLKYRDITVQNMKDDNVTLSLITDRINQVSFEVIHGWSPVLSKLHDLHLEDTAGSGSDGRNPPSKHLASDAPRVSPAQFPGAAPMNPGSPHVISDDDAFPDLDRSSWRSNKSERLSIRSTDNGDQQISGVATKAKRSPENVSLLPKQEERIRVWYLPLVPSGPDGDEVDCDRGKLQDDFFQLIFELSSGESRSVIGRARVCESILCLEKDAVHLGDCNVLVRYQSSLTVVNSSDLATTATISFVSQCVLADAHEIRIPPRESYKLHLEFLPRQVNPGYHKEITLTNRRNSAASSLMFTLRANCVDDQGISLHALYYKVLAPTPTNEVDFGVTVANHPAIRAMRVQNLTDSRLVLEFSGNPCVNTYIPSNSLHRRRFKLRDRLDCLQHGTSSDRISECHFKYLPCAPEDAPKERSSSLLNALVDMPVDSSRRGRCKLVADPVMNGLKEEDSVQSNGRSLPPTLMDTSERDSLGAEKTWNAFLECLEERDFAKLDAMPLFFSNDEVERKHTDLQFRPMRRLRAALEDGYLIETNRLRLEANSESIVVISLVLTDGDVRGKTKIRPIERKLSVRMAERDEGWVSRALTKECKDPNHIARLLEMGQISMSRDVVLTVQACKSVMNISPLRQLNFGVVSCGEQKDKEFTIVNLSEAPLLYEAKKGGNDGSNDLRLNIGTRTRGVVRPYFTKAVQFIFSPSRLGYFEEKILLENRLDRTAGCEVVVKAFVKEEVKENKSMRKSGSCDIVQQEKDTEKNQKKKKKSKKNKDDDD